MKNAYAMTYLNLFDVDQGPWLCIKVNKVG